METVHMRIGSIPVQSHHDQTIFDVSHVKRTTSSVRSPHFETKEKTFRRSSSASDLIKPDDKFSFRSRSLSRIVSLSRVAEDDDRTVEIARSASLKQRIIDLRVPDNPAGRSPGNDFLPEEIEFSGGGIGKGRIHGGGGGSGDSDKSGIGAYYEEMLKADPSNPLLLRNYGKFLHEVEKDLVRAEEYYGRAILASPGDGEVLSLYGKLLWETERDEEKANSYFDRAVAASPDDCYVLGSYAHFLWDAEGEEEEKLGSVGPIPSLVETF
ncbi:hypothetical protein QJS04_geneDACA008844 [Acorus gramineus]|uniref:TmcB/TmcC TPR repeats domain-containing protein n=1 Tax=Acorus gramineus TaxID=55184 RepID=A0AAV9AE89_ACOGR|nr:hypothetical protein QJS04_geneDACA008844 [Acorus gramineus]